MIGPETDSSSELPYERNAFIISIITAVLMVVFVIIQLVTDTNTRFNTTVATALAVLALVTILMNLYGRARQGMWLLIGAILFLTPVVTLNSNPSGFIFGIAGAIFASVIALATLPSGTARRVVVVSLVIGGMAIAIEALRRFFFVWSLVIGYQSLQTPIGSLFQPLERFAIGDITLIEFIVIAVALIVVSILALRYPNFNLRAKLISATVIVAILAVLGVTIFVSQNTRSFLTAKIGEDLNNLADSHALSLGEVLSRQISLVNAFSLNRAVEDSLNARNAIYANQEPEAIQALILDLGERWNGAETDGPLVVNTIQSNTAGELRGFIQSFPDHNRLILTDEYGALIAASENPGKYYFGDEAWWADAYAGGSGIVQISEPYSDPESNQIFVDIAVPVEVTDFIGRTKIAGILRTTYSLNGLAHLLAESEFGAGGRVELHVTKMGEGANGPEIDLWDVELDEEGNVILVPVPARDHMMVEDMMMFGEDFEDGFYKGVDSFFSAALVNSLTHEPAIDSLGWILVTIQPEGEALAPVLDQQRTQILLGGVIVIIASITAALVAQFLAKPILELTETATRVAEGDLSARTTVDSKDEIGTLAIAFNRMTDQLQDSITGLERRVNERTKALTASVEISRRLTTILDPDELVIEVVNQIRNTYEYYYVQIYLFNKDFTALQLVAGTGDAGQAMLARGHMLDAGQGLVGQAAAQNIPVFIPDVSQSLEWKANPLLPDTKAEIAVPIAIGDRVLGILDVQHDATGSLTEEDIGLLQSVAFQVAIALRNAQSYAQARQRAEHEALINTIGQKIQEAPSIDFVLQVAARELGQTLTGQKVTIKLANPREDSPAAKSNGNQ